MFVNANIKCVLCHMSYVLCLMSQAILKVRADYSLVINALTTYQFPRLRHVVIGVQSCYNDIDMCAEYNLLHLGTSRSSVPWCL